MNDLVEFFKERLEDAETIAGEDITPLLKQAFGEESDDKLREFFFTFIEDKASEHGFDLDLSDYDIDDVRKAIRIALIEKGSLLTEFSGELEDFLVDLLLKNDDGPLWQSILRVGVRLLIKRKSNN